MFTFDDIKYECSSLSLSGIVDVNTIFSYTDLHLNVDVSDSVISYRQRRVYCSLLQLWFESGKIYIASYPSSSPSNYIF